MRRSWMLWALSVACLSLGACASDNGATRDAIRVVLIGPPGAGKGTQAQKIEAKYNIPHISTGDILRSEVARDTELGRQVKDIMARGELVADDIVLGLVETRLAEPDCDAGFILDGFPRTIPQAEGLQRILESQGKTGLRVIDIAVPDEALRDRLLARKRADDTAETITNRIRVYHEETAPLLSFYEERDMLTQVDGSQSIEAVFDEIDAALTKGE